MAHSDDPRLPPGWDDISPREEGTGVPPGTESAPALSDGEARNLFGLAAEGCLPVSVHEGDKAGDRFGPFLLLETLGEGGFGIVWLAEQCEPIRRTVALKVIKPGMHSRDILARFERERQALALMDHPNIAAVLDAGQTASGRPWFSMERVAGMPITDYCDAERLGLRGRVKLFLPICRAVQHAHQKGVLHRDLKPSNLLVERVDGHAVPKIIDFGIAKALQTATMDAPGLSLLWTQGVLLVGTPLYMSPEQAGFAGLDVDSRSDIYSLGAVLHELLAGTSPLSRETLANAPFDEVLRTVREKEPSSLHRSLHSLDVASRETVAMRRRTDSKRLHSQLKGDLEWIVRKALEKDRERRYESAAALAQDLENYLHGDPVSAGPPGAAYRLGKMARRHRGPLVAGGLVLASLVAGLGLAIGQAARAMRAEHIAESRLHSAEKARDAAEELVNEGIYGMRSKLHAFGKVELMEDMVAAADAYYRGLPDELQRDDGTLRHLAALSLNKAMIAIALGRHEEHERHTRECLELLDTLLDRNPGNETIHKEAVQAMLGLCQLHAERGDHTSLVAMAEAIDGHCRQWLDRHPGSLWAMHHQVLAHNAAAQALVRELNRPLDGQARLEVAQAVTRQMRELSDDDPRVFECEGYMLAGQGKVSEKLGKRDAAEREHEAAMTAFAKALALGGSSALLREQHLSSVYRTGGLVRSNALRRKDDEGVRRGEALMLEALEGRKQLVALEPGRGEWWRDLAHSHRQFAEIAAGKGDLGISLDHRREELRCRDEAVTRNPGRPLVVAERSVTRFRLGDGLARLAEPDLVAAAESVLSGLEDHRAAIAQNGGSPVLVDISLKEPAETLSRLVDRDPQAGNRWIERARAILEPLAEEGSANHVETALGILAAARERIPAALVRREKDQARETELLKLAGGSSDPSAMHDRAHGIVLDLLPKAGSLYLLPAEKQRPTAEELDAALKMADPLLDAALAENPDNPAFLETLVRRRFAQGVLARYRGEPEEAVESFERALAIPLSHRSGELLRRDTLAGYTEFLRVSGRPREALAKADELIAFSQRLCESQSPPPVPQDFHMLGNAHFIKLGIAEALGDWNLAVDSCRASVEGFARAKDETPGDAGRLWHWLSALTKLAELNVAVGDRKAGLGAMPGILSQADALAENSQDPVRIRKYANERLTTLVNRLRDNGFVTEATQAARALVALRERLAQLGHPTDGRSQTVAGSRILLLHLLFKQERALEIEQELASVAEAIAATENPSERAEAHARLADFFIAASRHADAVREARAAQELAEIHDFGWRRIYFSRILAVGLFHAGEHEDAWTVLMESWNEAAARAWPGEDGRLRENHIETALNFVHYQHLKGPDSSLAEKAAFWIGQIPAMDAPGRIRSAGYFSNDARQWRIWLGHLAEANRTEDYRKGRRRLLEMARVHGTSPYSLAHAALAALALPLGDDDEAGAIAMAEKSLANRKDISSIPAAALARIRDGRPQEASDLLDPAMETSDPGAWLLHRAIAALAHKKAGQTEKAAATLQVFSGLSADRARFLASPTHRDAILARSILREAGWSAPTVP